MQTPDSSVPGIEHPRWRQIVNGEKVVVVENLGLKLLLTTIGFRKARDDSEATMRRNIEELHGFFVRHGQACTEDLHRLFA